MCISVPAEPRARTSALEVDDWESLAVVGTGRFDFCDSDPHCDRAGCFFGVERAEGVSDVGAEVEVVEFAVVEETHQTHPGPCYVVGVLRFEW